MMKIEYSILSSWQEYVSLLKRIDLKKGCLSFYFHEGAIVLGPRIDRFKDKQSTFISGHSIPHISLGGFILAFGFIAFNAGSHVSL